MGMGRRGHSRSQGIDNNEVARIFERLADLLDIDGASPFRIRAYRNAASLLESMPRDVSDMIEKRERLEELPGIGRDLAGKIEEIVKTGHLSVLDEMETKTPPRLPELMRVPSLGPKRIHRLHEALGVEDLSTLAKAAREGRIRALAGFGAKTEQRILKETDRLLANKGSERMMIASVEPIVEQLVRHLRSASGVKDIVVAGSYRRRRETVGDLDILVTCKPSSDVMNTFIAYPGIRDVVSSGTTRSTVVLTTGLQVDVRVVAEESYGAALYYFTGSKNHTVAVRGIAQALGVKINEYGVFKGEKRLAGRTEEEVLGSVGLPYIEPVLRENRGEIEAAREGRLPRLVTIEDLKGDLHAHTTASDGKSSLEEMIAAARARGYEYLAITDHSKSLAVARGLDEKRLLRRLDEIDRMNESLRDFRILKAAEVDILQDGSLDYSEAILKQLDLAVCSIHTRFGFDRERQTERLLRAIDNPYCDILGHLTGRLIGSREPYEIDLERVLRAARKAGCAVEANAQPERLDLNDLGCRMAKEFGVKVVISSDSHSAASLALIRYGVDQARRGWLEPKDVLNTLPLKRLLKNLRRNQ